MKKILFVKIGKFSHINSSLLSEFRKQFSQYSIEVLDVLDLLTSFRLLRIRLKPLLGMIFYYGKDFLTLKKSIGQYKQWELCNPVTFGLIKKKVKKIVKAGEYAFTFQTQSLFDASTGIVPHFVYTDSTVLATLSYPDVTLQNLPYAAKWLKMEPDIYKNASFNFTFSSNQLRSMIDDYNIPPEKVKCVFAGSNIKTEPVEIKDYSSRNILFIGLIEWERKGGPVLLKAFRKVRKQIPDATLTIVGCNRKILRRYHSETELEGCIVKGEVSKDQIPEYFKRTTIFCLPTRNEPFGIVFLESMMYKVPIVASNIGALPDLIQNNDVGFLVNPDDVDGFANAIFRLLSNPELCRKMGERAYKKASVRYTWKNTVALMKEEILKHLS